MASMSRISAPTFGPWLPPLNTPQILNMPLSYTVFKNRHVMTVEITNCVRPTCIWHSHQELQRVAAKNKSPNPTRHAAMLDDRLFCFNTTPGCDGRRDGRQCYTSIALCIAVLCWRAIKVLRGGVTACRRGQNSEQTLANEVCCEREPKWHHTNTPTIRPLLSLREIVMTLLKWIHDRRCVSEFVRDAAPPPTMVLSRAVED